MSAYILTLLFITVLIMSVLLTSALSQVILPEYSLPEPDPGARSLAVMAAFVCWSGGVVLLSTSVELLATLFLVVVPPLAGLMTYQAARQCGHSG